MFKITEQLKQLGADQLMDFALHHLILRSSLECTLGIKNIYNRCTFIGGKPSGKEVVQRRSKLDSILTAGFVEEKGSEVSLDSVLAYADLGDDFSTLLPRTVKHLFPSVSTSRRKDGMYPLSQIYLKYAVY